AAAPKSPSETTANGSSRRWTIRAVTTRATIAGNASAARSRCAVSSPAVPETTARSVAADAPRAVSRIQGPGALPTALGQLSAQIVQRPRTRHVGNAVEVVRGRRRGRVPLERIRDPGVVAGPAARAARLQDVHDEHEDPGSH